MRFLIDANLPRSIIALVASLGHEVEFARDVGLAAAPDHDIAARAQATVAAPFDSRSGLRRCASIPTIALSRDYRIAFAGWCDRKGYRARNGAFSAGPDICWEPLWAPRNCGTGSRALPACTDPSRVGDFGEKGQLKLTPNSHPAVLETHTQ